MEPKVFNLSDRQLTDSEIKLLSKGLKYTPTPHINNQELKTDIKAYTRRLRLTEYFHDRETDESTEPEQDLVRNKSDFNPKRGRKPLKVSVRTLILSLRKQIKEVGLS